MMSDEMRGINNHITGGSGYRQELMYNRVPTEYVAPNGDMRSVVVVVVAASTWQQ